jgi:hypothetical protein
MRRKTPRRKTKRRTTSSRDARAATLSSSLSAISDELAHAEDSDDWEQVDLLTEELEAVSEELERLTGGEYDINPKPSAAVKKRILAKLDRGESLSTKDFEDLGYPFELFLRYAQLSGAKMEEAHETLRRQLGANPGIQVVLDNPRAEIYRLEIRPQKTRGQSEKESRAIAMAHVEDMDSWRKGGRIFAIASRNKACDVLKRLKYWGFHGEVTMSGRVHSDVADKRWAEGVLAKPEPKGSLSEAAAEMARVRRGTSRGTGKKAAKVMAKHKQRTEARRVLARAARGT